PPSHCGGIWNENTPSCSVMCETGRLLPASATKAPTNTSKPDNLTSNHEGTSLPSLLTVRSQRPINPSASSGTTCVAALCISSSCFCMVVSLLHEIIPAVNKHINGPYTAYFFIIDKVKNSKGLIYKISGTQRDDAVKFLALERHNRQPALAHQRNIC